MLSDFLITIWTASYIVLLIKILDNEKSKS